MPQSYDQLYDLIERNINVEEATPEVIESFLVTGKEGGRIKYGFDKKGGQRYFQSPGMSVSGRSNIRKFAEGIGKAGEIYSEVKVETDIRELKKLRREATTLDVHSIAVVSKVDEAIELAEEVKRQEQEILEKESGDWLIRKYKEAETVEEEKELRKELKAELPYSLRSIKGWGTRKGALAFKQVFGED